MSFYKLSRSGFAPTYVRPTSWHGSGAMNLCSPSPVCHMNKLKQVTQNLLGVLGTPFSVGSQTLEIGASIGVSRFPTDGTRHPKPF